MQEYFNFCLLCALFTLIFYLYIRIKKYFPILKWQKIPLAVRNQTQSIKNSSNAFSLGIATYILALGVIGSLAYYIYRSKKGKEVSMPCNPTISQPLPRPQTNKFEMD